MIQVGNLSFKCATGLARGRFVSITPATDTVAYTNASEKADAITLGNESGGTIAVQLLSDTSSSFFFESEGTIGIGDGIEVGTDGKGLILGAGIEVAVAKSATIDGSMGTGYNI